MPRRPRRLQFGEYYHVIHRGSVRGTIFHSETDYQTFITLLAQTVIRFEISLLAYCVMPNHWHMVVKPKENRDHPRLLALPFLTSEAWLRLLNERVEDVGISEAVRRNRPFASDDWVAARMAAMGIPQQRKPGRPRE